MTNICLNLNDQATLGGFPFNKKTRGLEEFGPLSVGHLLVDLGDFQDGTSTCNQALLLHQTTIHLPPVEFQKLSHTHLTLKMFLWVFSF